MDEQQVVTLLKKYKEGTLSPDEKARLETWYIDQASKSQSELTREKRMKPCKIYGQNYL